VSAPSLRLFFALWPDDAVRAAIASLAREVAGETRGRAVAPDNVHLTLAFLGERPAAMVPDLCACVSTIGTATFNLSLDDIGCWRKTGIAWLTARRTAPPLLVMHDHIVEALGGLHIVIDERKFMPHVTLARRIEAVVARRVLPPIEWQIGSFALVASVLDPAGVRYDVLKTWPDPGFRT
jgi:2'-5' RNA ligase